MSVRFLLKLCDGLEKRVLMKSVGSDLVVSRPMVGRNQAEARRVADKAYPFRCCVICGLQLLASLQTAHLDHDAANNVPDNLASLCPTHHGMYDAGLYPIEAIRILRAHWQTTQGKPNHKPRMKDAGVKAALARKRSVAGHKAAATRRANAALRV